ncbi:type IV conjugative transfer system lipoprotein TraV [Salmonella enterica]|uniref:Type IV conjugative transfer system protein TraV n=2 Tax=Salmonella enterica TaxID=28901 RepID=A0A241PY64_SALET|nr:type IV conjugative transfer system lipoprotein TraV [Salmonella enterica]ECJ4507807.1 type IV conjugative transfer system protein TraV [Salmonella enterica subsp. salamae]EHD0027565.1 type IV conjugative transfer system lipoprotein TraV [Salmonella enterica subsp. houtenae serovar 50:g,z51:-]ASG19302.1 type IV conjugative transfer system protein TraV [Salmonella enterica subsp. enterica serovar Macclesfield str. S-1643]EEP8432160.1 type IV conjugative transfer system lipoprotein TraV [Salmo
MNRIVTVIPFCGALLLSGCAGTNSDFECNATTSDTCMTMEQANEKAKGLEQPAVKPAAASLPRLAEGNFRTRSVQTNNTGAPADSNPVRLLYPEQKRLTARPQSVVARGENAGRPACVVSGGTPPRPLRLGEQTAALWIAPYIDSQDVYHQPSGVFFVIKPSAWGKPRIH